MIHKLGKHLATGGGCEVYEYGEGKVIKLHFADSGVNSVKSEYDKTLKAWELGLPAPYPYEVIEVNGRCGLVMERINGETLMDIQFRYLEPGLKNGNTESWLSDGKIYECIKETAEILYVVHAKKADGIPSFADSRKWDAMHTQFLSKEEGAAVCEYIDSLPKGDRLCHGDPNPGNIIDDNGKMVVVDWVNSGIGNPMVDLAEYVLMTRTSELPESTPKGVIDFVDAYREHLVEVFLNEYKKLSYFEMKDVDDWLLPLAVSKLRATTLSYEGKQKLLLFIRGKLEAWRLEKGCKSES